MRKRDSGHKNLPQSKTYRTPFYTHRTPIEHLSNTFRRPIEHLSNTFLYSSNTFLYSSNTFRTLLLHFSFSFLPLHLFLFYFSFLSTLLSHINSPPEIPHTDTTLYLCFPVSDIATLTLTYSPCIKYL